MKQILFSAFIAVIIFSLSGCVTLGGIAQKGATGADTALQISAWGMCDAASVGSIRRWIGDDPGKIEAWQTLCAKSGTNVSPNVAPKNIED